MDETGSESCLKAVYIIRCLENIPFQKSVTFILKDWKKKAGKFGLGNLSGFVHVTAELH